METFIGQLLALLTFFAFPAIQYIILKRFSKKEGRPELWYLPAYSFRLVIRNIPNKRTLSELKCKTVIRKFISRNIGASVSTIQDETLIEKEDFFLLPGYDQILVCFKVIGSYEEDIKFIQTDKLGNSIKEFSFSDVDEIISDYTANIENLLNFDAKISKRVIIDKACLISYWQAIKLHDREQRFDCREIVDIG